MKEFIIENKEDDAFDEKDKKIISEQERVAELIKNQGITIDILKKLGEIEQERVNFFFPQKLISAIESSEQRIFSGRQIEMLKEFYSGNLDQKLEVTNSLIEVFSSSDEKTLMVAHKIIDFIYQYGITSQDPEYQEKIEEENLQKDVFFSTICSFLESHQNLIKNYLIEQRVKDLLEMWQAYTFEKPDSVEGVAGGNSDETIYVFKHTQESFENRKKLGIRDGYLIANPVLQVAPGYYGYYVNGLLEKVYSENSQNLAVDEEKYFNSNNKEDEYIYDQLNKSDRNKHYRLQTIEILWKFKKRLKEEGKSFYFDVSKINLEGLHPLVLGEVLHLNLEYIKQVGDGFVEPQPLSEQDFSKNIFTFSLENKDRIYLYKQLTRISTRKKIEEDFGVNVSKLPFALQINFLEFLNKEKVDSVNYLKNFVKKFSFNGIKTFLSLEQDPTLGDKIISFGENVDSEIAQKVFEKYSEIVDQAFKIEDFIADEFKSSNFDQKQIHEIRDQLLLKAKDTLLQFIEVSEIAKQKGVELSGEETEIQLEKIKTDTILLASTLRSIKASGQKINLEDIKNLNLEGHIPATEVRPEDQSEMLRIYKENYKDFPNLQQKLIESNNKSLQSDQSEFTILRYKDELTGFYRLDNLSETEVHFAAFNVDSEFRGAGLGEAMMLEDLDKIAKEKIIKAECDQYARISSNYIERGFVAIKYEDVEEKGALSIIRDDVGFKERFPSKKLSQEEIVQRYVRNQLNPGSENLKIICAEKQSDFDFEKMLADGQNVVTRYFKFGEKGKERWYVVLEQNPNYS